MKRYKLELQKLHGRLYDADIVEYENGEWVKFKDADQLKEQNRELTATLKRVNEVIIEHQSGIVAEYIVEIIEPVLAKAEIKGAGGRRNNL